MFCHTHALSISKHDKVFSSFVPLSILFTVIRKILSGQLPFLVLNVWLLIFCLKLNVSSSKIPYNSKCLVCFISGKATNLCLPWGIGLIYVVFYLSLYSSLKLVPSQKKHFKHSLLVSNCCFKIHYKFSGLK